jgi:hypothetical protein
MRGMCDMLHPILPFLSPAISRAEGCTMPHIPRIPQRVGKSAAFFAMVKPSPSPSDAPETEAPGCPN